MLENKENERDWQQIHQSIANCYDVDDSTTKMLAIKRQILGLDKPQFYIDILKKKQRTIMDMVDKRRPVLQTLKDEKELKELNEKFQHCYADLKKYKHSLSNNDRLIMLISTSFFHQKEKGRGRNSKSAVDVTTTICTCQASLQH
ncbi:unnamed protein product [Cylicostephanus goldi]|uniref:Uncharacterized protein n=1 Tax=Cylicostephanus goldi TaxID=71465 RepID=A0A3P6S5A3_CYLGO|nr:unnamed protein product [Cylicostephanus goldi]